MQSGPSAKETAACAPIVKVALPPERVGTGVAIAIPTKLAEKLMQSGDPTLAQKGRVLTSPGKDSTVYVNAFVSAQAECRKIGAG